jgi:hypothetical protein
MMGQTKKFLKSDVEYVFSYLVVMHLKHVLSSIAEHGVEPKDVIKYLS